MFQASFHFCCRLIRHPLIHMRSCLILLSAVTFFPMITSICFPVSAILMTHCWDFILLDNHSATYRAMFSRRSPFFCTCCRNHAVFDNLMVSHRNCLHLRLIAYRTCSRPCACLGAGGLFGCLPGTIMMLLFLCLDGSLVPARQISRHACHNLIFSYLVSQKTKPRAVIIFIGLRLD